MLKRYGPATTLLLGLILLWEFATRLMQTPVFILPPPSRILQALWEWREALLFEHLPVTLTEVLIGLLASVVGGVAIAAAMHLSALVNRAFYPLIIASQTIPTIAISPVFLLWFGYSLSQKVAVVCLITFFPMAVGVYDGLRSTDPDLLEWLRAAGAGRWRIFRMAELPSALPAFFTSLKIAATYSVVGAVLGEWLGGQSGLGVYGRRAGSSLKAPELWASVVVLTLLGIVLFLLASGLERRFTRWRGEQIHK